MDLFDADKPSLLWPLPGQQDAMSRLLARNWWAVCLRGAIAILFGLAALIMPAVTLSSLLLLFGFYMVADGVLGGVASLRAARHHERWGLLALEALANLAIGAIIVAAPSIALLTIVILLGAWSILSGGLMLAASMRLHPSHGRALLILSGVVSVVWGLLLYIAPITGAMVLTWWLGGYALAFGAVLVGLGLRLRRHWRQARDAMTQLSDMI